MTELKRDSILEERECPECGSMVPVHAQYVTWCDQCNWNIQPLKLEKTANVFESMYDSLGRHQSQQLFDKLQKQGTLKPTLTFSKVLAFFFASLIYLLLIFFFVLGVKLIFQGWGDILRVVTIFLGILSLAFVFASVPRPVKIKRPVAAKASYAHLYKLVNDIARNLGSEPIDKIVITPAFNASFVRVGWMRKRVVVLGYALWSVLSDQERVALIAHEVAHNVNGDQSRRFFIGSAIGVLATWYVMLIPDQLINTSSIIGLLTIPFNFLLYGLAKLVSYCALGLAHLLWRDSQRAEYLADYLSAKLAGTEAALDALKKPYFSGTFSMTVQNVTLNWERDGKDMFSELKRRIDEVPERELERIRRIAMIEDSRLNVTHPPTPLRIEMLRSQPVTSPEMEIDSIDFDAVEQEFVSIRDNLAKELRMNYLQYIGS